MNILINYADPKYHQAQKWCTRSGKFLGKFDKVYELGPKDIDEEFKKAHNKIFSIKRGAGCWLWKSYIIRHVIQNCKDGDYIFYFDSGLVFIHDPRVLLSYISDEHPIFVTDIPLIESCFTKPECFDIMEAHEFEHTNQIQSGYIIFKVNPFTRAFFEKYFELSHTTEMLIPAGEKRVDQLNRNYGYEFVTHREDQSILSLLCKKNGIKPHRDLSQRGFNPMSFYNEHYAYKEPIHDDDKYPSIVYLHKFPTIWKLIISKIYNLLHVGKIRRKIKLITNE